MTARGSIPLRTDAAARRYLDRVSGRSQRPAGLSPDKVARLIHYMTLAIREPGTSDWDRKFCASVIRASRGRRTWVPTVRQVAVMERITARLLADMRADARAGMRPDSGGEG